VKEMVGSYRFLGSYDEMAANVRLVTSEPLTLFGNKPSKYPTSSVYHSQTHVAISWNLY
jgi:hypothetical protein